MHALERRWPTLARTALAVSGSLLLGGACGGSRDHDLLGEPTASAEDVVADAGVVERPSSEDAAVDEPVDGGPEASPDAIPRPRNHRRSASTCDDARPPGTGTATGAYPPMFAACRTDEECTSGRNGRCSRIGFNSARCTYDECRVDADCPDRAVCACDEGWFSRADVCLPSNCRVDADCGPKGWCSPSTENCQGLSHVVGYFCRTRDDECREDVDCPAVDPRTPGYCRFDAARRRWSCATSSCFVD